MDNKTLIKQATQLCKKLLRNRLASVGALFLFGNLLSMNLEDQTAVLGAGDESLKLVLTVAMGLWDLTESILLILVLSWGLPNVHPLKGPKYLAEPFKRSYFPTFMAEYLRVLGQVLLWGMLLIVPGFVKYVRYMFVPLIVLFSQDYEKGDVDALELSARLSQKCFNLLLGVFIAVAVAQVIFEMSPQVFSELHTLPVRLAFNLISFLISIWSYSFIVLLFEREMER